MFFTRLELYEVDGLRGTVVYLTFFNLKALFLASCYSVISVSVPLWLHCM